MNLNWTKLKKIGSNRILLCGTMTVRHTSRSAINISKKVKKKMETLQKMDRK